MSKGNKAKDNQERDNHDSDHPVKKWVVGIDLGTSNCAVAYTQINITDSTTPDRESYPVRILDIPQIVNAGQLEERPLMPSALYFLQANEASSGQFNPPGYDASPYLIGEGAKALGARLAERVVTSAKSWLCNARVDRHSRILPWGSTSEEKLSPVTATKEYLRYIQQTLENANLTGAEVVITVPASFDEVARNLTLTAAQDAGFSDVTLLEEPLSALYAWIECHQNQWRKHLHAGDVILVCDVGGGTADFSLVAVDEDNGNLTLDRISVGDHLLLGGDNMDLALSMQLRASISDNGTELDLWQFQTLIHLVRSAKERLLLDRTIQSYPITIPTRGANLFSNPITVEIKQSDVETIILEGFFPLVEHDMWPQKGRTSGLQEVGLSYVRDAALTKHLAEFLARSYNRIKQNTTANKDELIKKHSATGTIIPDAILFNGGVFNSDRLRARIFELLKQWGGRNLRELTGVDRDTAVAFGASSYGRIKSQKSGIRIKAGTTRSYYIGIESTLPAVPGFSNPLKGCCVLPYGSEEGDEFRIEDHLFFLLTGEETAFRLFYSTERTEDKIGDLVQNAEQELNECSELVATIPNTSTESGSLVQVRIGSKISEVGVLEVSLHNANEDQNWKLEFNVRPIDEI
jgi:molecular chaperone DnaK (HSP70)